MLTDYFLKHHECDLIKILNAPIDNLYHSIYVNFVWLIDEDPESANEILCSPRVTLPLCNQSIVKAQQQLATDKQTVKEKVRTRITGIPVNVKQGKIGEFVTTRGVTVRISQPTILQLYQRFRCRKCEHVTVVELDWEKQSFPEVKECEACHAKSLSVLSSLQRQDSADYQEIKIQESSQIETSNSNTIGLQLILMDDLIDKCRPGDHVDITGYVIRRWSPLVEGSRMVSTMIMIVNTITVDRKISESTFTSTEIKDIFTHYWDKYKDNPLLGRDNIIASICPQLFGMYTVKLALAVILAGGVPKVTETGNINVKQVGDSLESLQGIRKRGEPHLLLIGDPGTGKSQLLRAASRLAVRSVLTTGIGTTAAGLTAAAVKDTDGWHLEGGALVLADGGVCCVDEFTTMSLQDRASLHEAMEQQTISVAKAGLVSTLNSRCTVVAAINPVGGKFIEGEEMKTRLGNPLLSRFDLILLLKDNRNLEWDKMTSQHIINAACGFSDTQKKSELKKPIDLLKSEGLWKEDSLREYLAHVHNLQPVLSRQAEKILSRVFMYHRQNPDSREDRSTIRLLDSLIRLAEGHARLMYRKEVNVMDAVIAAQLIGTLPSRSKNIGCPFPLNPEESYYEEATEFLTEFGLESFLN